MSKFDHLDIPRYIIEIGDKVIMCNQHPWAGQVGKVVRMEKIKLLGFNRPVVRLNIGQEVFIMADGDARIIEKAS